MIKQLFRRLKKVEWEDIVGVLSFLPIVVGVLLLIAYFFFQIVQTFE